LAILRALPHSNVVRLGLVVRTRFVDELLLEALRDHPITTVLSVGCGLDTRPWWLDFQANLRWIDIEFVDVLDYKDKLMFSEAPRCPRERLAVDLNDVIQRRAMYEAAGAAPALMITEGLLLYLPAATVEAPVADLHF
jgi:O-methyltransferase involved in polyketide biosynthesis